MTRAWTAPFARGHAVHGKRARQQGGCGVVKQLVNELGRGRVATEALISDVISYVLAVGPLAESMERTEALDGR
jgi:hypothetical protein